MTAPVAGRYALVVAVSQYRDPRLRKLRAPAADARRLAAVLADPEIGGCQVEVALDDDEATSRRRIAAFFANRRPDDLLLAHFSCHGVKDEGGELYLAARDTEIGDLLSATGISAAWLNAQIGRTRSKRVVLLLDCCFSGSFPLGLRSRAGTQVDVHDYLDGRGRAVITASSAMEYAYEGDQISGKGQPSIFTSAVVEGLETGQADEDGDGWISVDDLYGYVYDRVRNTTPWQNPNKLSNLEGPLQIARSVRGPDSPATGSDAAVLGSVRAPRGWAQPIAAVRPGDWRTAAYWQKLGSVIGAGAALALLACALGSVLSWPLTHSPLAGSLSQLPGSADFGDVPGPVGYAVLTLPLALGLPLLAMLAQRAQFSLRVLAACGAVAAGLAATAGAIHASASAPRNYDMVTAAIVGTAMGLAATLPRKQPLIVAAGAGAGAAAGALAGLLVSGLGFAQFETEYLLFNVVLFLILAIPLCLLIALLPARSP